MSPTFEARSRPWLRVSACFMRFDNRPFPWAGVSHVKTTSWHRTTQTKVFDFILGNAQNVAAKHIILSCYITMKERKNFK